MRPAYRDSARRTAETVQPLGEHPRLQGADGVTDDLPVSIDEEGLGIAVDPVEPAAHLTVVRDHRIDDARLVHEGDSAGPRVERVDTDELDVRTLGPLRLGRPSQERGLLAAGSAPGGEEI